MKAAEGKKVKYMGIPFGMWLMFEKSFTEQLVSALGYDEGAANGIKKSAKRKYKEIIHTLPQFERDDRFQINIVSCAMLGAFVLAMPKRPTTEELADYYEKAMMTKPMKWFCAQNGKNKFSEADKRAMQETAAKKNADRNLYSWNMDYCEYADGAAEFVREYTLASGGLYCDCGYKKKGVERSDIHGN